MPAKDILDFGLFDNALCITLMILLEVDPIVRTI